MAAEGGCGELLTSMRQRGRLTAMARLRHLTVIGVTPGACGNQGDACREVISIFTRRVKQGDIATEDQEHLIPLVIQQAVVTEDEA